jgi:hypothetical protein
VATAPSPAPAAFKRRERSGLNANLTFFDGAFAPLGIFTVVTYKSTLHRQRHSAPSTTKAARNMCVDETVIDAADEVLLGCADIVPVAGQDKIDSCMQ